ncbi:MAG: ATP-dependent Clp protease ATP-binding subunit [bacterium]|nr:ATP-dependent Clp protease ATP-binding subunit [bacterium]
MIGNLFNRKRFVSDTNQNINVPVAQTTNVPSEQSAVVGSTMKPSTREDLSVLTHLDPRAANVLNQAQQETQRIKQALIEPEQLLFGLLFDGDIFQLLSQFSLDAPKISRELAAKERMGTFLGQATLNASSRQIFEEAYKIAKNRESEFISPEDLLMAIFSAAAATASFLNSQGLKKEQLEEKLAKSFGYTSGKKTVLDKFGIDLTEEAKNGELDPVVGRDREVERLIHILLRRTKNNPIIIGDAGVGKTAIIEGFAQKIVKGEAPKDLSQKRIVQLDVSSLVAGASHRGEFEERLRDVIKEVQMSEGRIILFIDEIHTLIGAGDNDSALDASNIIKPFLARGKLQVIGTTTTAEYRRYFEKDKAFERRFQPILADEPTEEVAEQMLNVVKPKYEKFHNVVVSPEAVKFSVHLSKRYIGERLLPDKAVDLLDEASAQVRLERSEGKRQDNIVKEEDIEKVVSSWTGIPITKLTENESEKLLHLEDLVHKKLIDQEAAVSAVSESVRRGRIGLSSANRPIASFVFLGPTGVGKTELAKTLAEILFGKQEAMIRLDMSEYMEKHEVAKLIGAPPGYVGYEEGGQLTEAVRAKPYSIVLLDEIEKAHPDVFNILLQLLEDGRLTDNKGNTISFKNTIIIATSNIGSSLIQQNLAGTGDLPQEEKDKKFTELSKVLGDELHKFFKPELLNRFDEVVIFEPLKKEDMLSIAKLGIGSTSKLLKEQNLDLDISQKALDVLAEEGYDPVYGARPLRRLIQSAIENPIAILIINKTFVSGDKILIDYDVAKQEFNFNKSLAQNQTADGINKQGGVQDGVGGSQVKSQDQTVATQSVQPGSVQPQPVELISQQPVVSQEPPVSEFQPIEPPPQPPATPPATNGVAQQVSQ